MGSAIRKLVLILGIIGALWAAKGLSRFGHFVGVFKGADAPYYHVMLLVALFAAGVLLLAVFGRSHRLIKWVAVVSLICSITILMAAPSVPVLIEVVVGLTFALVASFMIPSKSPHLLSV